MESISLPSFLGCYTAWCSENGSLHDITGCTWITCISDVREPISLNQAIYHWLFASTIFIITRFPFPTPPRGRDLHMLGHVLLQVHQRFSLGIPLPRWYTKGRCTGSRRRWWNRAWALRVSFQNATRKSSCAINHAYRARKCYTTAFAGCIEAHKNWS